MQIRNSRQLVTSLTVNAKVNVRREYYKRTRAMCDALFKTGQYADATFSKSLAHKRDNSPDSKDVDAPGAGPKANAKMWINSLGPLSGRLAHIHYVKDKIDTREEIEKRRHKTTFRQLYFRFLFYEKFVALDRPLILTEGKTDNVYLSLAIKHSPAFQPKLGTVTPNGFRSAVRLFNHLNKTREVLELDGGSGNFKFFVQRYKYLMATFLHKPQAHPVILLLDNDGGAKEIFSVIKKNYGIEIKSSSTDAFFHITDNLYVVTTPHVGSKMETCIEDLFEPSLLKEQVAGKTLSLGSPNPATEYGKHVFAEKVVRPTASTVNWGGFAPLLQRISDVVDDYKPPR
jgi:hypothetical protein